MGTEERGKAAAGDEVRRSSRDPREAQNKPARALRRPIQRASTLMKKRMSVTRYMQGTDARQGPAIGHPRPELGARADARVVWVPPSIIVPLSGVEGEVEFGDGVFA